MPLKARHALLPLALALPLAGCGSPQVELEQSDRLEALLPSSSDYPDGFDVETVDITDVEDDGSAGGDWDSVSPSECEDAMDGGPGDVPEEAAEGAAQTLTPSGDDAHGVYVYMLTSGEFQAGAEEEAHLRAMLDACSSLTATYDDMELEGSMAEADSPALPEGGDGFTMDVGADGFDMATTVVWAQVEDVHFLLMGMNTGAEADVSPHEIVDECEIGDRDCRDRVTERAESDAQDEIDAEFDEVLEAGVAALEAGL
ncbi:hypothetical protein IDM40_02995 [Nocardiopsis sp. HNM0947]|uniref:Lipoprotein n=1 Tax=Nocardiopsis coralli TaxID=2772213 RepID=A0ABR9P1G9_9ACTN|nr:hypothetical protein [Nocardiopsis coralli]MBE2997677.1 hypothetical protein [Nocardiopsis coralli]